MGTLIEVEPPPDAGISLLGTYGLANPMMVWLLNRRPDLLAETPAELGWQPGAPPVCDDELAREYKHWTADGQDAGGRLEVTRCGTTLKWVRLDSAPFTDRLVRKFRLPVTGWRGQ